MATNYAAAPIVQDVLKMAEKHNKSIGPKRRALKRQISAAIASMSAKYAEAASREISKRGVVLDT